MLTQHRHVIAAVVAQLAPSAPELADEARAAVLRDVADFVAAQVERLPSFMRVPYAIALTGFDWLPMLRYGRPFRRLSPEAQARCVAQWTDARLRLRRDFVKLMRSCALLAYFDHPVVRKRLDAVAATITGRGPADTREMTG